MLAVIISLSLHYAAPSIARLMGLSGNVLEHATTYLQIICWLILVLAGKGLLQTILNIYGKPQWNMHANIVYFIANIFGNAVVVFGLFGFPKMGVTGVAWASVIGSLCGVVVSAVAVLFILKYRFIFRVVITEFRSASRHIRRLAVPSMVEPLSFDLNMVVLNAMAASLGAVALAAKIYTFNIFMLGLIISVALTTATEVLMTQKLGAGKLQEVADQLRQSLKAGIWGTGLVAALLVIFNQPVMGLFTDNEILLSGAVWLFLLAALSEPPRTANIMVGRALRVSGDGWFISIVGPLFTWLVAVPLAWLLAMYFQLGVYGILIAAVVDETTRALLYLRRWKQNRWHHTNIHAEEQRSGAK